MTIEQNSAVDPALIVKDANGVQNIQSMTYFEMDMASPSKFHLYQTKGFYARHRPCYFITENEPT